MSLFLKEILEHFFHLESNAVVITSHIISTPKDQELESFKQRADKTLIRRLNLENQCSRMSFRPFIL